MWEPFSQNSQDGNVVQNVYKNELGTKIVFEEVNQAEQLLFRFSWSTGDRFGFVKSSHLVNLSDASKNIRMLDGLQNVLPGGMEPGFQLRFSNLGDAYKKNELLPDHATGVYYLSSVPTDRAEPSEGLLASAVWNIGLEDADILLCDDQVADFRAGRTIKTEPSTRGKRGSYLASTAFSLAANDSYHWMMVADVNQDQTDVSNLLSWRKSCTSVKETVLQDVAENQAALEKIISSCDGVQSGAMALLTNRHKSNVTFNAMRGGVPFDNYRVCLKDFKSHLCCS